MPSIFLGTKSGSVNKKRVIIPAQMKAKITNEAHNKVICTLGPNNSVAVYPMDSWELLMDRLQNGTEEQRKSRTRLINWADDEQDIETNGRIVIGDELLQVTGIKESVIIKGFGAFIALFEPEHFKTLREQQYAEIQAQDPDDYQL